MQTHSLMHYLYNPVYLKKAARNCMRRKSSPGLDQVKWKTYRKNLNENIELLSNKIRKGEWQPSPLKYLIIRDFSMKELSICIPTIEDRIVQRCVRNIVEPILEKYAFRDFVSGFRRGRSRLTAVRKSILYLRQGNSYVLCLDIHRVGEGIDVEQIIDIISKYISDGNFLRFIKKILYHLPYPLCYGSGLSPMLINLRLSQVDDIISDWKVVRFADDFCIFCLSEAHAQERLECFKQVLSQFHLQVSEKKCRLLYRPNPEDLFLI